jgi:hypothetical protein
MPACQHASNRGDLGRCVVGVASQSQYHAPLLNRDWSSDSRTTQLPWFGVNVTGGPGALACLEIWPQGQEPSGVIWALPTWAPGQIEGMRVGGLAQRKRLSRISSERQLQPEARRKARQELWSIMPSA